MKNTTSNRKWKNRKRLNLRIKKELINLMAKEGTDKPDGFSTSLEQMPSTK
jgi:hypothetical protein